MADFSREKEEFKAANRTFGGEWKLEMKVNNNNNSSSLNQQPSICRPDPPAPPQPALCLSTPSTKSAPSTTWKVDNIDKYSRSYYKKSNVTLSSSGNAELKRQRRLVKYNSYTVESRLKSSLMNGIRWMKNKYCEFVHGY